MLGSNAAFRDRIAAFHSRIAAFRERIALLRDKHRGVVPREPRRSAGKL